MEFSISDSSSNGHKLRLIQVAERIPAKTMRHSSRKLGSFGVHCGAVNAKCAQHRRRQLRKDLFQYRSHCIPASATVPPASTTAIISFRTKLARLETPANAQDVAAALATRTQTFCNPPRLLSLELLQMSVVRWGERIRGPSATRREVGLFKGSTIHENRYFEILVEQGYILQSWLREHMQYNGPLCIYACIVRLSNINIQETVGRSVQRTPRLQAIQ